MHPRTDMVMYPEGLHVHHEEAPRCALASLSDTWDVSKNLIRLLKRTRVNAQRRVSF